MEIANPRPARTVNFTADRDWDIEGNGCDLREGAPRRFIVDAPHHQFRNVSVPRGVITFDYRNNGPKRRHIYAIVLADDAGGTYVLDPYIKNGPAYAAAEYM